jgi:hypothetical protein
MNEWDPPGSCLCGCGMPKNLCIYKPQPFKTLTQSVREAEADVNEEDLKGLGLTMEEWQQIRSKDGVFCPFAGDGKCPSMPECFSNRERLCVNGGD